jgi:hypothetical protein
MQRRTCGTNLQFQKQSESPLWPFLLVWCGGCDLDVDPLDPIIPCAFALLSIPTRVGCDWRVPLQTIKFVGNVHYASGEEQPQLQWQWLIPSMSPSKPITP